MLDIVPVRTYPATLVRAAAYDGCQRLRALGRTRLSIADDCSSAPKNAK